ncbi:unnamed protein product [Timema podura]|uniref:Schwannomin interacting protein 1 C-terminal domain-containing protein n=1 Tax=Timema podura TaxID=61482 RepID=A0ABN7NNE9_TIMPD|nr:unnamed protein product [Timema podura]
MKKRSWLMSTTFHVKYCYSEVNVLTQWANNYVTSPNTTGKEVHHLSNDGSNFNNNITASLQQHLHRSSFSASSDILSESSPDDSLGDFEEAQQSCSSSSLDVSPQGDEYRCFSHDDLSDSDSLSSDGNCQQPPPPVSGRGIDCLCCGSVVDSDPQKHLNVQFPDTNIVDVGETKEHEVNIVGDPETKQEDESSNVSASVESDSGVSVTDMATITLTNNISATAMGSPALSEPKKIDSGKMGDAYLPVVVKEEPPLREEYEVMKRRGSDDASVDSNRASEKCDSGTEKFCKEEQTSKEKEKDDDSVIPRKKEKMELNYSYMSSIQDLNPGGGGVVRRREAGTRSGRDLANRRSLPAVRDKSKSSAEILGGFDVYNIETAMPKIDLDAIEAHLKAAKEEERRVRETEMEKEVERVINLHLPGKEEE